MHDPHSTAFPSSEDSTHGLTKRQWMATLLMQGILSSCVGEGFSGAKIGSAAEVAVKAADALIVALRASPVGPTLPPCAADDQD